jgi:hypothetical protein
MAESLLVAFDLHDRPAPVAQVMTTGGDGRITLDPETGLNRYFSAPWPRPVLAYASSTANDISPAAFAHVEAVWAALGGVLPPALYAGRLEALRARIRAAYGLDGETRVVFAASGTELEYVALACAGASGDAGLGAVLLGADEVGSGCINAAAGRYFTDVTPLGLAVLPGQPVAGLGGDGLTLIDAPVRGADGAVRPSREIAAAMRAWLADARRAGRRGLVHVVHGSKTGLILPGLADIDALRGEFGDELYIVVDACQARITGAAMRDYLARDAVVLVTGSKFMGGPPFSGFALVPARIASAAAPLAPGLATIFRRGEWPADWPGADALPHSANPGLLLRLEAAVFELEAFQRLPGADIRRVTAAFQHAVRAEIAAPLSARIVPPHEADSDRAAEAYPVEMRTMATLDLRSLRPGGANRRRRPEGGASFEDSGGWHRALLDHGVRLGQPVRCVRLPDGRWGATLRIGMTMRQIVERAVLDAAALQAVFADDMCRIACALVAAAV